MSDTAGKSFIDLTASIVSAYLSNNPTPAAEIPGLISQVHAALVRVSTGRSEAPLEPAKPAVSVKKSISPDYPMVAPNYAVARSQLAKEMGLGQQRQRRK